MSTTVGRADGAHLVDRLEAFLAGEEIPWNALDASPEELLDACAEHDLSALVHQQLSRSRRTDGWPAEVRGSLATAAHAAAARELVRARELASVLNELATDGVRPILIKGAALAYTVYESPGCRPRVDTDVLVRRDEVERARQTIRRCGYTEAPMSGGELVLCQFHLEKTDALGVEHVLDVHWKISTQPVFADILSGDELEAACEAVPSLGPHARAAGGVHALLLACIHPVMHHHNALRRIWIYDVHLLASRLSPSDLDDFTRLVIDKRVAGICAEQLALAREWFGTSVPEPVMDTLATDRSAEPSAAYLRPGRRWHHELLSSLESLRWRDRARLLREVLLPGPRYMLAAYGVGRGGLALLPALYAHRVAYGVWKILRGRK